MSGNSNAFTAGPLLYKQEHCLLVPLTYEINTHLCHMMGLALWTVKAPLLDLNAGHGHSQGPGFAIGSRVCNPAHVSKRQGVTGQSGSKALLLFPCITLCMMCHKGTAWQHCRLGVLLAEPSVPSPCAKSTMPCSPLSPTDASAPHTRLQNTKANIRLQGQVIDCRYIALE
jgi:hypothetical protein